MERKGSPLYTSLSKDFYVTAALRFFVLTLFYFSFFTFRLLLDQHQQRDAEPWPTVRQHHIAPGCTWGWRVEPLDQCQALELNYFVLD